MSAVNWDAIFSANITVQGCWDAFTCVISDIFERFIPGNDFRVDSIGKNRKGTFPGQQSPYKERR